MFGSESAAKVGDSFPVSRLAASVFSLLVTKIDCLSCVGPADEASCAQTAPAHALMSTKEQTKSTTMILPSLKARRP